MAGPYYLFGQLQPWREAENFDGKPFYTIKIRRKIRTFDNVGGADVFNQKFSDSVTESRYFTTVL